MASLGGVAVKLSVLVCSVSERLKDFSVIEKLCEQAKPFDDVEVLWLGDNRRMTTGEKRNTLVGISSGRYVCFVDDDDGIADDYIESIRTAADENSDVICFKALWVKDGAEASGADYSMEHEQDSSRRIGVGRVEFTRLPSHICAIERGLVVATRFNDMSLGEDRDFSKRLRPLLKTETKIDKCLYFYNWTSEHSVTSARNRRA